MKNSDNTKQRTGYIFFLIFILLASGIVAGGYFSYRNYEENYRAEVEQQLSAIADLKVNQLVQWRKERLEDGQIYYKNYLFSTIVKRYLRNRNDRDAKKEILIWAGQLQNGNNYNLMMLLDAQMNTILVYPENKEQPHFIIDQKNTDILHSGNIAFQDFYRNDRDQHIYLKILVPILDDHTQKRMIAVLALRISPEVYLYPLMKKWPTRSRTSETLLIRKDGTDALYLNDLKFHKDAALKLRIPLTRKDVLAVKAVSGIEGIVDGIDYRGKSVIGAVRAIPDSPWFIVVRMDMEEVYAPLKDRLWQIIIFIAVLIGGAGSSVGFVWRHQRLRFYKEQFTSLEALRDSENRYRRLFETARDGILILNAETGMIVDVNPFLLELLGYSREVFLGKQIWELGFFKDIIANQEKFLELQLKEYIRYDDLPLETIKGNKVNVEFISNVYLVDHHKVIQCNIRDITERKRVENKLKTSEAMYRRLFEAARDGILILDVDTGMVVDVNPFLIELLGYSHEQFLGKRIWELGFFKDDAANKLNFKELKQKKFIHYENMPLETANGRLINVEFISYVYQVDHHNVIQCNIRDITDRIRAEEKIKNNEKYFRDLIESLPQLFWTCRVDGPCDYLSKQWVDYTGIPEEEQLGYRWLEQLHPEDKDGTVSLWTEKVKLGNSFDVEFRVRRNDGVYRWFKTRAVPMYDAENNIVKWFGSNTDVEDMKNAEVQLRCLNDELEQRVAQRTSQLELANKELEAFSYSVSHDLRAPLRHIGGYVELLGEKYKKELPEKGLHYLEEIIDSVRQMGMLIDDLLKFSRSGRVEMHVSAVDMNWLVKEVSERLRQDNPQRTIDWSIAQLPSVHCDNAMLHLVWENLLSNAVKFTRTRKTAKIEIGVREENKEFVFFVRDNGVGFDMQYAQKLFGVFQRLHSTAEFEGTGIGLANVHRIIARHGGRTWAEAEQDKGATFYFSLPK